MRPLSKRVVKKEEVDFFENVCPACGAKPMKELHAEIEIPYVGRVLEITLRCESCAYKYASLDYLERKEAVRFSYRVNRTEDLTTKIYRSKYGILEVTELGLKVEPGVVAEGYLTNVEGVLNRFRDILQQYIRFHRDEVDTEEDILRATTLIDQIEEVKTGKRKVTIVLTDPTGISSIVSDQAKRELLSPEETRELEPEFTISIE